MTIFVETRVFTNRLSGYLDDDAYRSLQNELAANPKKGAVIPGCGGLRKIRVADRGRGKGKRGGARVVYLDIPEAHRIDLVTVYGKDEQDDLTFEQKRVLSQLAKEARAEAMASHRRGIRRPR